MNVHIRHIHLFFHLPLILNTTEDLKKSNFEKGFYAGEKRDLHLSEYENSNYALLFETTSQCSQIQNKDISERIRLLCLIGP